MKQIHTEIEISAPAERVWELLTDFAAYPQWNPFIRYISGRPVPGERLEVRLEPPGGRGMTFSSPRSSTPKLTARSDGWATYWCRACLMVSTPSPSSRWKRTVCVSSSEKSLQL